MMEWLNYYSPPLSEDGQSYASGQDIPARSTTSLVEELTALRCYHGLLHLANLSPIAALVRPNALLRSRQTWIEAELGRRGMQTLSDSFVSKPPPKPTVVKQPGIEL